MEQYEKPCMEVIDMGEDVIVVSGCSNFCMETPGF